jgi:hypothetical protein
MYVKWNWDNINVDFIRPKDVTLKRLHGNDMNFMLIYDLLESFHVDDKKTFENFKNTLKKCNNIYPPYYYQKFINNKCLYINHLQKKKSPVIPTYCVMKQKYNNKTPSKLREVIKKNKWNKFIGKPVYGQEGIYFRKFTETADRSLQQYLKKGFKKYPGLIFQKYIEGFDKQDPEIRLYFIGNDYKYSIVTTDKTVRVPKNEGGTAIVDDMSALISTAKSTIRNLPQIKMKNGILPRLLTRIDISCGKHCKKPFRINEVEFVPSLYLENVNFIPEIDLGDNMVKIAKKFKKISHIK